MACGRGDCPCRPAPLVDLYERWYDVLRGYRMESAGPALRELNSQELSAQEGGDPPWSTGP